jgi:hypothetical protein
VRRAVKLGLTAYTLEWDGHVQAMTGRREFWSGTGKLSLRAPTVRLASQGGAPPNWVLRTANGPRHTGGE